MCTEFTHCSSAETSETYGIEWLISDRDSLLSRAEKLSAFFTMIFVCFIIYSEAALSENNGMIPI